MEGDELELEKIGDRKTALFCIVSDTDMTFNFISAMVYTQMFNVLCDNLSPAGMGLALISLMKKGGLIVCSNSILARYRGSVSTRSANTLRGIFNASRAAFTSSPKVSKLGQSSICAIQHHPHTFYIS